MSDRYTSGFSGGARMTWSDDLSVGIRQLDAQHKNLLSIINKLAENQDSAIYSETVSSIFGGLMNYVKQHFSLEEELMQKHGYAGLEEHKGKHLEFLEEIVGMMTEPDHLTVEELLNYLVDWFESHVRHDDQEYGKFFAEKGVS